MSLVKNAEELVGVKSERSANQLMLIDYGRTVAHTPRYGRIIIETGLVGPGVYPCHAGACDAPNIRL